MDSAVRLQLDGVGSRVVTQLCHRTGERMTVMQALPFLRLNSGVRDDEGRAARIESVRVLVENDTPSLEIDLVYEREPFGVAPRYDDTVPGTLPAELDDTVLVTTGRRDETVQFETQRREPAREIVVSDPPPAPGWRTRLHGRWLRFYRWLEPRIHRAERFVDAAVSQLVTGLRPRLPR